MKKVRRKIMMKKLIVAFSLVFVLFGVAGCGKTINNFVEENMSEITKEFYFGENDSFYATLSVGERESTYLYNGQSTESVDFALLTLTFKSGSSDSTLEVVLNDGTNSYDVELLADDMSVGFMADVVNLFDFGETFTLNYEDLSVELTRISDEFGIDYQEALNIACENLKEELESQKSYNNFNAECYLRVLREKENSFDNLYWCFTCLDYEGESFSVVFSTVDGKILAKSEENA